MEDLKFISKIALCDSAPLYLRGYNDYWYWKTITTVKEDTAFPANGITLDGAITNPKKLGGVLVVSDAVELPQSLDVQVEDPEDPTKLIDKTLEWAELWPNDSQWVWLPEEGGFRPITGIGAIKCSREVYDYFKEHDMIQQAIKYIIDGLEEDAIHVEITWEEYQALTEEEKMNGTIYFITDADEEEIEDVAHVELTYEEYLALGDEAKNSGKIYFVTDYEDKPAQMVEFIMLTWEEYQALSPEEKDNGNLYFVIDLD